MPGKSLGNLVAVSVLLLPLSSPSAVGAGRKMPLRAAVVSHGVEVALTLPRRTYPRGALVPVTVRVAVQPGERVFRAYTCGMSVVEVDVLNDHGDVVYPLPLPAGFSPPSCAPILPGRRRLYPPGYTHVWHMYAVLWGRHVQALFRVGDPSSRFTVSEIVTPRVSTKLTPRIPPSLSLPFLPHLVVAFHGSGVHHRKLRYSIDFICQMHRGVQQVASLSGWSVAPGPRFVPEGTSQCKRVREVRLLAGYPDHPVARLDYSAPSGT